MTYNRRGRNTSGEKHPNAKFVESQVKEIYKLCQQGHRQLDLARQCGQWRFKKSKIDAWLKEKMLDNKHC